jgi:hypothetical protein
MQTSKKSKGKKRKRQNTEHRRQDTEFGNLLNNQRLFMP